MKFRHFFTLLILAAAGVFVYFKVQADGPMTNTFNQTQRYQFGKHPLLRAIFGLHNASDARAEYLTGDTPFVAEFVHSKGSHLTDEAINLFVQKVSLYTGRTVVVYNVDTIQSGQLTSQDLDSVVHDFRRHVLPGQPNIFVMYSDDFLGDPNQAGRTYKEFGMVLSDQKLVAIAGTQPEVLNQYIASVMLHEFGFQIGLTVDSPEDCIMNPEVESPLSTGTFTAVYVPTQFCGQELTALTDIKRQLSVSN